MPKGQMRPGHKYIRRTGGPGNYRYWYKDPKTGAMFSSATPVGGAKAGEADEGAGPKASQNVLVAKRKDGQKVRKKVVAHVPTKQIVAKVKHNAPYNFIDGHSPKAKKLKIPKQHAPEGDEIHGVKHIVQANKVVGHMALGEEPIAGLPAIVSMGVDPEHQGKGLEKQLINEQIGQGSELVSRPMDQMDPGEAKAWQDIAAENKKVRFDKPTQTYFYSKNTNDKDAPSQDTRFQPAQAQDFNKHIADAAQQVFNEFVSNGPNFNQINEGIFGKKGTVSVGNDKFFIKSDTGLDESKVDVDNIDQSKIPTNTTNHEVAVTEIMHTLFPELKDSFPAKYKVNDKTFIQDFVDMSERSSIEEVVNADPERACKLAIMDYILGNRDRHGGNMFANGQGQLILFDDGLAFSKEGDICGGDSLPQYVKQLHNSNTLDDQVIREMLDDKKVSQIEAIAKKNGVADDRVAGIRDRFNNLTYHLNASEKLPYIPAKKFLTRLVVADDPIALDEIPKEGKTAVPEKTERSASSFARHNKLVPRKSK